jgi:hypothetical protein
MAEVTGRIGQNDVELNNAATEATLKQLLAAMIALGAKSGKEYKSQAALEKDMQKFIKQMNSTTTAADKAEKQTTKLTDAQKKQIDQQKKVEEANQKNIESLKKQYDASIAAEKAIQDQIKGLKMGEAALNTLSGAMNSVGSGIFSFADQLANAGNNLAGANAAFSKIPVFGGMLSTVFGAVASAAEKSLKSFQDIASVGGAVTGGYNSIINSATAAGLTMDQFTGVVKKNSEGLALFGGSVGEGIKRFTNVSKQIQKSGLASELQALGYSTEDINSGLAGFSTMLAKTGAARGMTDSQLAASAGAYLKNLDAVSKLTGKNREDLQKEHDERMRDAQFRLMMRGMDADSQANLHALMDSIPKEHQAGLKEIMATGTATSESGVQAMAFLKGMGVDAQQFGLQVRNSKKLTKEGMLAFSDQYQKGAKAFANSPIAETLGKFGTDAQKGFVVASLDVAERTKTLGQTLDETAQAQKDAGNKQAAAIEDAKKKMAELSNRFIQILANSSLLPLMLSAFEKGMEYVTPILINTIEFIGKHGKTFGAVMIGVLGALALFKAAVIANQIALQAQALKTGPLGKALDAATGKLTKLPLGGAAGGVAKAAGGAAGGAGAGITGMISNMLGPVGGMFSTLLKPLQFVGSMFSSVGSVITRFLGPIGLVIGAFVVVKDILEEFGIDFGDIGDFISETFTEIGGYISETLKEVGSYFQGLYTDYVQPVFETVGEIYRASIKGIVKGIDYLKWGFMWLSDKVIKAGQGVSDFIGMLIDNSPLMLIVDNFGSVVDNILAMLPSWAGGISKEEKERRDALRATAKAEKEKIKEEKANQRKAEADAREAAMKQEEASVEARRETREKAKADKAAAKAAKEKADADTSGTAATEAKTEAEAKAAAPNAYNDPATLLKQFNEQQTRPTMRKPTEGKPTEGKPTEGKPTEGKPPAAATPAMEGLGKVAAHFESGGKAGTISTGHGDLGGKSYGAFQLSSKTGDVDKFLKSSGYAKQFEGLQVGSAGFDKKWKELSESKEFATAQQQHAVNTHYNPQMEKLKKSGLDLSGKGAGVQEAIMSTANQYGANTDVIQKALSGKDAGKMSDKDIINAIQDYKSQTVGQRFKSSSASVQAGVQKRVEQERAMLLATQGDAQSKTADAQPKTAAAQPKTATEAKKPNNSQSYKINGKEVSKEQFDEYMKNNPEMAKLMGTKPNDVTQSKNIPVQPAGAVQPNTTATPAANTAAAATTKDSAPTATNPEPVKTVQPTSVPVSKGQDSAETLLTQLNMQMGKLIAINERLLETNDRQLKTQRNMANGTVST